MLDRYFEPCLAFFFPQAHADIDWARGYEMLDKELQPIVRRPETGRLYVDKLVKVWLRDGQEKWLLIHIEVQAGKDRDFPRRMHVYNHRIFDRYNREVVSLAILADDPKWRPGRYEYSRWGFRSLTEFPVVELLDYAPRYQELESDPNPFAVVVLAHLKAMETRRSPAERRAWKPRLVKGLDGRGMTPEDVRRLFDFIDSVLVLPDPLDKLVREEIAEIQQEGRMRYINSIERYGIRQGLLRGIEAMLRMKFGDEGLKLMPELRECYDHLVLEKILDRIEAADTLDQVRRTWNRNRRPKEATPNE